MPKVFIQVVWIFFIITSALQVAAGDPPGPGDSPGNGGGEWPPPFESIQCPEMSLAGWAPVGESGLDDHVWDLAAADASSPLGPALFACGNFLQADGTVVNHVSKWDGSAWSALSGPQGIGTDDVCTAIEISPIDGLLYAGGAFEKAGGDHVFRFAQWDGSNWKDLSFRLDRGVNYALEFFDLIGSSDPELVMGGTFHHGGEVGLLYNGLAWRAQNGSFGNLGPFPDVGITFHTVDPEYFAVQDIEDFNGDLYIGGSFETIGTLNTNNIGRLDGLTSFAPLDQGLGVGASYDGVQDMEVYDGELYVGGLFAKAGSTWATNIARWSGETWSDVALGTNHIVEGLKATDIGEGTALYAAGFFDRVGVSPWPNAPAPSVPPVAANFIARWQNGAWSPLLDGLGPGPGGPGDPEHQNHAMVIESWDDGEGKCLYVGGRFQEAGLLEASNIARWCCFEGEFFKRGRSIHFRAFFADREIEVVDDGDGLPEMLRCEGEVLELEAGFEGDICDLKVLVGSEEDDEIFLEDHEAPTVVFAGPGRDEIHGSPRADLIFGADGDDQIFGRDGDDHLYGGAGEDLLIGGPGEDLESQGPTP